VKPQNDIEAKGQTQIARSQTVSTSQDFALSRRYISHLRTVSLKSQIRLASDLKHSICKRCDIPLMPGSTSTSYIENKSRGGQKAWADVQVVICVACGTAKRHPIGAKRQANRGARLIKASRAEASDKEAVHDPV